MGGVAGARERSTARHATAVHAAGLHALHAGVQNQKKFFAYVGECAACVDEHKENNTRMCRVCVM